MFSVVYNLSLFVIFSARFLSFANDTLILFGSNNDYINGHFNISSMSKMTKGQHISAVFYVDLCWLLSASAYWTGPVYSQEFFLVIVTMCSAILTVCKTYKDLTDPHASSVQPLHT